MSPTNRRSKKPVSLVILLHLVAYIIGYFTCYWYVAQYGGMMPPPGSFDDFIADSWIWATTGFLGPISATLIINWLLSKRTRRDG